MTKIIVAAANVKRQKRSGATIRIPMGMEIGLGRCRCFAHLMAVAARVSARDDF